MTPDSLLDQARQRSGLDNFGDPTYEPHLDRLCHDLATAPLSEPGRNICARQIGKELIKRLKVVDCLERHPEILETPLPPIVLITGLARTGTTLLQQLLALHPKARPVLRWELLEPVPPPDAETRDADPRIAKVQAHAERMRDMPLARMHFINAIDPEECAFGFYDCTGLFGRAAMRALPTHWDAMWFGDPTAVQTFREYRALLQLLTWKSPPPTGGFLLLKCPQVAPELDAWCEVFPDAHVVWTHRDPFRSLVSTLSVSEAINDPMLTTPGGLRDDGTGAQKFLSMVVSVLERLAAATDALGERAVHVRYADLTADVVGTVTRLLSAVGHDAPPDLEQRVDAFLDRQRSGHRPRPPGAIPDFGYTRDGVQRHPTIASYRERFQVPAELRRVTDVERSST